MRTPGIPSKLVAVPTVLKSKFGCADFQNPVIFSGVRCTQTVVNLPPLVSTNVWAYMSFTACPPS
jgi:hypothetical protein